MEALKESIIEKGQNILARYSEDSETVFKIHRADSIYGDLAKILVLNENSPFPKGEYLHSKSQRLYTVLGIVKSPDSGEIYVWYQAEYNSKLFGEKTNWVRPFDNFNETVRMSDGSKKERFEYRG